MEDNRTCNIISCGSCGASTHSEAISSSIALQLERDYEKWRSEIKSDLWELPCKHTICFDCFENQEKHEWVLCEVCNSSSHVPDGAHYYYHLEMQNTRRSNLLKGGILKFQMRLRIRKKAS